MPKYSVTVPISGEIIVAVFAENEEMAEELACSASYYVVAGEKQPDGILHVEPQEIEYDDYQRTCDVEIDEDDE